MFNIRFDKRSILHIRNYSKYFLIHESENFLMKRTILPLPVISLFPVMSQAKDVRSGHP